MRPAPVTHWCQELSPQPVHPSTGSGWRVEQPEREVEKMTRSVCRASGGSSCSQWEKCLFSAIFTSFYSRKAFPWYGIP